MNNPCIPKWPAQHVCALIDVKEIVGISRCSMADISNEEITALVALIITLWVRERNKESCYITICEMTP